MVNEHFRGQFLYKCVLLSFSSTSGLHREFLIQFGNIAISVLFSQVPSTYATTMARYKSLPEAVDIYSINVPITPDVLKTRLSDQSA